MGETEEVTFPSGRIKLEGVLHLPDGRARNGLAAVVCHPHPLFGGSMDNLVVVKMCEALAEAGVRALRFNFRGVGASGGDHSGGEEEASDVVSAMRFLKGRNGKVSVGLAGYSFGAGMALLAALGDIGVKKVACVALPARLLKVKVDLSKVKGLSVLLIGGSNDTVAPLDDMKAVEAGSKGKARLEVIQGTDHFFGGKTQVVGKLVAEFLVGTRNAQKR